MPPFAAKVTVALKLGGHLFGTPDPSFALTLRLGYRLETLPCTTRISPSMSMGVAPELKEVGADHHSSARLGFHKVHSFLLHLLEGLEAGKVQQKVLLQLLGDQSIHGIHSQRFR